MDHPFRTAAFGGFNRQDVLTYLEEHAAQSVRQCQELEKQLDEQRQKTENASRQADALGSKIEQMKTECQQLQQERDALMRQLEQANAGLSAAQEEKKRDEQALKQVQDERNALREQLDALTPDARAYTQLKDRTAGMELDAHCRALAVQEKAEQEARRLRRQVEQWLQGVEREYGELCSQVESTVSHAALELEQANTCLERVNALMGEQGQALESLARAYAAEEPGRVAPPMPIPEQ